MPAAILENDAPGAQAPGAVGTSDRVIYFFRKEFGTEGLRRGASTVAVWFPTTKASDVIDYPLDAVITLDVSDIVCAGHDTYTYSGAVRQKLDVLRNIPIGFDLFLGVDTSDFTEYRGDLPPLSCPVPWAMVKSYDTMRYRAATVQAFRELQRPTLSGDPGSLLSGRVYEDLGKDRDEDARQQQCLIARQDLLNLIERYGAVAYSGSTSSRTREALLELGLLVRHDSLPSGCQWRRHEIYRDDAAVAKRLTGRAARDAAAAKKEAKEVAARRKEQDRINDANLTGKELLQLLENLAEEGLDQVMRTFSLRASSYFGYEKDKMKTADWLSITEKVGDFFNANERVPSDDAWRPWKSELLADEFRRNLIKRFPAGTKVPGLAGSDAVVDACAHMLCVLRFVPCLAEK